MQKHKICKFDSSLLKVEQHYWQRRLSTETPFSTSYCLSPRTCSQLRTAGQHSVFCSSIFYIISFQIRTILLVRGAAALAINQFASVKIVSVYHQFRLKLEGNTKHQTLNSQKFIYSACTIDTEVENLYDHNAEISLRRIFILACLRDLIAASSNVSAASNLPCRL